MLFFLFEINILFRVFGLLRFVISGCGAAAFVLAKRKVDKNRLKHMKEKRKLSRTNNPE